VTVVEQRLTQTFREQDVILNNQNLHRYPFHLAVPQ
jgi:hypothetical protein